ncbi:TIGR03013 family XrtA/PEP-CTERM system glycosyltransferase, partial [Allosphingosinicella sp.]|uniref:TIGR03013 family XrtA/PEP-CTERM system glycosyltransferase n=1 Tax=Allosphingosinicella sp. TaxID=2823234 RepID=UPI002EF25C3C
MIRLFKHYVPHWLLLLGLLDAALLLAAGEAGWLLRLWQIGGDADPETGRLPNLFAFAAAIQLAMFAVGVYRAEALVSLRVAAARLVVAAAIGILVLSLIFFLLPTVTFWRSNLLYATALALALLVAARLLMKTAIGSEAFKRRVLVLGAGPRAARIEALAKREGAGFAIAGYVAMNDGSIAVARAVNREAIPNFAEHLVRLRATEVVLALEERRNALPLADLLRAKTTGMEVNDLSSFLERETGRVDLDSLNPSWLIFSDGFSAGRRLSSAGKRLFDILISLVILVLTAPLIALTALAVKLESRGPA